MSIICNGITEESKMNWNEIFEYKDGTLYWRIKPSKKISVGSAVTCKNGDYLRVGFKSKSYMAHRIVWELHNGPIAEELEVDHINHIKTDNRIENLRVVSRQANARNMPKPANNTTGIIGVTYHRRRNKWQSQIKVKGKTVHLGLFERFEDACAARIASEVSNNFHPNHGK